MVFLDNYGGTYKDGKLNKYFEFQEFMAGNNNTAYMLAYVRKSQTHLLTQVIKDNEITEELMDQIQNTKIQDRNTEMTKTHHTLYVTDFESLKKLVKGPGFLFTPQGKKELNLYYNRVQNQEKSYLKIMFPQKLKAFSFQQAIQNASNLKRN